MVLVIIKDYLNKNCPAFLALIWRALLLPSKVLSGLFFDLSHSLVSMFSSPFSAPPSSYSSYSTPILPSLFLLFLLLLGHSSPPGPSGGLHHVCAASTSDGLRHSGENESFAGRPFDAHSITTSTTTRCGEEAEKTNANPTPVVEM